MLKMQQMAVDAANPFVAIPKGIKDFELTADAATQAASDLGAMIATIPPPMAAVNTVLTPLVVGTQNMPPSIASSMKRCRKRPDSSVCSSRDSDPVAVHADARQGHGIAEGLHVRGE